MQICVLSKIDLQLDIRICDEWIEIAEGKDKGQSDSTR